MSDGHVERQRRFYAEREHAHLRPRSDEPYARKLAGRLAAALGIGQEHRVAEIGAGFGRFTFELLAHCGEVVAVDFSERALAELRRSRDALDIPEARCRTLCADATHLGRDDLPAPVDFVVGFFLLHHLPDPPRALHALARLLPAGGALGFVEPNRRNPLFLAQIAVCPDMTWREEKGMFLLSRRGVERALAEAGLAVRPTETFGFFPPPLLRADSLVRLEERLERLRPLRSWLPFLLLAGRAPAEGGAEPGSVGHR